MSKTVLVLGGAYGGLHVAHALLKKQLKDVKVVLVTKNTHFYWNLASIRRIIPGQYKDEDILKPIEPALKRYPSTSYELIIGSAEAADFASKTVRVATATGDRTVAYDQLVLATGSRTPEPDMPWKASSTYEEVVALLKETEDKVKAASHIVVAGAGATGVELAGELGFEFGKTKEIILLSAGDKVLGGDIAAPAAANELKKLNVAIKYGAKVESTRPAAEGSGKTEVVLAGGETIATDLYLPTMGLVPNTEYVPTQFLNENKTVKVDEFLRVLETTDVWAAGDVVSKPRAGFMITQKQAAAVAKNVELALADKAPLVAKGLPVDILACAVGRSRGAGRMNSFRLPSLGVWLAKGRTLGLQMMGGYLDGGVA
ncbi:apoptosis-inducing factor B [Echria macrotheca]|uniref:Apoptosis-inducing factor B n=1 Tax=Echria macrotheca TaxID=438768 RepID=A0AAJ0B5J8_9PEZI|nr:apoptosis-inducing factor B [Echria macrotheca]